MSTSIKFVVNTIARVKNIPEDDFDNDSQDEELDETFKNYQADPPYIKDTFPYEIEEAVVKKNTFNRLINKLKSKQYNSKVVDPLLEKLTKQAFRDGKNTAKNNISVCIYLNKMVSLSRRRNYSLYFEMSCNHIQQDVDFKKIAYFWCCSWRNKTRMLDFEEVQKYYKQLKKFNKDKAKEFLRNTEDKVTFVPYQQLRDDLKNHNFTKDLIAKFRNQNDNEKVNVYLSIIDEDTINFNGIYDDYISEISKYAEEELPRVISTGYVFPTKNYPQYLASEIDRQIRISIAEYFPFGVYYPEPNMCVLVPKNCGTVPESFIDEKKDINKLESAILLKSIIQEAKNRNKNEKFVFFNGYPLVTKKPKRSKCLNFSSEFKDGAPPTKDDFEKFKNIPQSNYKVYNWMHNLFINDAITLINSARHNITDETNINKCENLVAEHKNRTTTDQRKTEIKKQFLNYMDRLFDAVTRKNARQHCISLIANIRKNIKLKNDIENITTELQLYISPEIVDKIIKSITNMEKCIKECQSELVRTKDDEILLNLLKRNNVNILNFIKIVEKQECKFKDAVIIMNNIQEIEDDFDPHNILVFTKPKTLELIKNNLLHISNFAKFDNTTLKSVFYKNKVIGALESKSCDQNEILQIIEDDSNKNYFIDLLDNNEYSAEFIIKKCKENRLHSQSLAADDIAELVCNSISKMHL